MLDPIKVLSEKKSFAVVGATKNERKFGFKILAKLKSFKKTTYPVNPQYEQIDGERCYPSVHDLPKKPDVVVSVVPPRITEKLIDECVDEGISILWLQPGTYTNETVDRCKKAKIEPVFRACILAKLNELS
jgi:predicted CoA-binding protein